LEENPSDKAEILRKLKKDYESLSEYAAAVKEIKAETAASKKTSENGSN